MSDEYYLTDDNSSESLYFDRLYLKLYLFEKLTTITIERKTNEEIEVLEHVVENCKSLQNITFTFTPSNADAPYNTSFSIETISNLTPRQNIKILKNQSPDSYDEKTLIYITHKYPSLRLFDYYVESDATLFRPLNQNRITQLLQYLSNIEKVEVLNLRADENTIADSFTAFCQRTGQYNLEIYYTNDGSAEIFDIAILKEAITITLFFTSDEEWKHVEFLEKNGKFATSIRFRLASESNVVPDNLMDHIVTYCPNFKSLWFEDCTFEHSTLSGTDFDKRISLEDLSLEECKIGTGVLEHWSHLFSGVKNLEVREPTFFSSSEILMPCTIIDMFTLYVFDGEFLFKLYVTSDRNYYYYSCRGRMYEVETSSEQEYLNAERINEPTFYVCSQTKPTNFRILLSD